MFLLFFFGCKPGFRYLLRWWLDFGHVVWGRGMTGFEDVYNACTKSLTIFASENDHPLFIFSHFPIYIYL